MKTFLATVAFLLSLALMAETVYLVKARQQMAAERLEIAAQRAELVRASDLLADTKKGLDEHTRRVNAQAAANAKRRTELENISAQQARLMTPEEARRAARVEAIRAETRRQVELERAAAKPYDPEAEARAAREAREEAKASSAEAKQAALEVAKELAKNAKITIAPVILPSK